MITWSLTDNWDLSLDSSKNIALKDGNEQIAQDVCSSIRVFKGELPFDINRGVAYNKPEEIRNTLNFDMREQAKYINGVAEAQVVFEKVDNRELLTSIYVTTNEGEEIEIK